LGSNSRAAGVGRTKRDRASASVARAEAATNTQSETDAGHGATDSSLLTRNARGAGDGERGGSVSGGDVIPDFAISARSRLWMWSWAESRRRVLPAVTSRVSALRASAASPKGPAHEWPHSFSHTPQRVPRGATGAQQPSRAGSARVVGTRGRTASTPQFVVGWFFPHASCVESCACERGEAAVGQNVQRGSSGLLRDDPAPR